MNTDRTLIIVPTYNGRENVPSLIGRLLTIVPDADTLPVDDPPDGTADHAAQLFNGEPRFSALRRAGACGLRHSYVDVCEKALGGNYARLVRTPTSRTIRNHLIHASRMADVVIGSRYMRGEAAFATGRCAAGSSAASPTATCVPSRV